MLPTEGASVVGRRAARSQLRLRSIRTAFPMVEVNDATTPDALGVQPQVARASTAFGMEGVAVAITPTSLAPAPKVTRAPAHVLRPRCLCISNLVIAGGACVTTLSIRFVLLSNHFTCRPLHGQELSLVPSIVWPMGAVSTGPKELGEPRWQLQPRPIPQSSTAH